MNTRTGAMTDSVVGMHYQLAAYVRRGVILPPPKVWIKPDGNVLGQSFGVIFQNRPKEARFAVARAYRLRHAKGSTLEHPKIVADAFPTGPYVVWDLDDEQLKRGQRTGPGGVVMPPPPLWMGPNAESMTMKALSFYDYHP